MQKLTAFLLLATVVVGVCLAVEKTQEPKNGKDNAGNVGDKAHAMSKKMGKPDMQKEGQKDRHMRGENKNEAGKPNRRGCKCGPRRRGRGQRRGGNQMDRAGEEKKAQQDGKMKTSISEGDIQMGQRSQGKGNGQRTNGNRGASKNRVKGDRKGQRNGRNYCKCGPRGGRGGRRGISNKGQSGNRRGDDKDKKTTTKGY